MNELERNVKELKKSAAKLSITDNETRANLLLKLKDALERNKEFLFSENKKDMDAAKIDGISETVLHRLLFTEDKLTSVLEGLELLSSLPDPLGRVREKRMLDEGLILEKVSVPIGVIGMIFEARPDAMIQIIGLAIRTGNGIILKGGKEAKYSNQAILKVCQDALSGAPYLMLLSTHSDVDAILKLDKDIDLLIPRGSNAFVRYVMEHSNIPVLGHAAGICAVYVDKSADIKKALDIVFDSKTQYPAACNAVETLLVHKDVAKEFLPLIAERFRKANVEMLGDEECVKLIGCKAVDEDSYDTEFLALKLAIKIVPDIESALEHIAQHSSHHTEAIVTEDEKAKKLFFASVDSADVFCNASTRFADGFRFGLGAEVGISTSKIHARGPVGLEGLTSTKWLLSGNGQVVSQYTGPNAKKFIHKDLPHA